MSCRPLRIGPISVWTKGSTVNPVFHSMTSSSPTAGIKKVRVSFGMYESSGDVTISPAFQVSNDCLTWSNLTNIGTPQTRIADGVTNGEAFNDIESSIINYKYVRFGLKVHNTTNAAIALANAWFELDTRPC